MRSFFTLLILQALLFATGTLFAEDISPPSITQNVHVLTNTTPANCPSSWNGSIAPDETTGVSGYGIESGTAVGVQSCTGCAFDNNSRDCVCKTCYGYYN